MDNNSGELIILETQVRGERLDAFVADKINKLTRSRIKKLISNGDILVNGSPPTKAGQRLKEGDSVTVSIPLPKDLIIKPERLDIDILYEDTELVVVNKPRGMVVHPAAGNYTGTLVNALLYHCHDLSGIGGEIRPGIVHRLDKDTTGVLIVAKTDRAHQSLAGQFKERSIVRKYNALVHGNIKEERGKIDAPLGRHSIDRKKIAVTSKGRKAVTNFRILERYADYTFIEAILETGRTHQIRVHFSYFGFPLVGDTTYGYKKGNFKIRGQALHALLLGFIHPQTGKYMEFSSPLPEDFQSLIEELRRDQR